MADARAFGAYGCEDTDDAFGPEAVKETRQAQNGLAASLDLAMRAQERRVGVIWALKLRRSSSEDFDHTLDTGSAGQLGVGSQQRRGRQHFG